VIRPPRGARYDYTQAGASFVTNCARDRARVFADVRNGEVCLTPIGEVVASCWDAIPDHFPAAEAVHPVPPAFAPFALFARAA
jgi:hypothetical protein